MNKEIKVAVTIPSYRQQELLKRTLSSLRDQTYKNFEVIILDDQSGVNFREEFADFFEQLTIKVVTHTSNIGAMRNLLESIMFPTEAPYVFSLHEDDYIAEDYIERAVEALEREELAAFVLTSPIWISGSDTYKKFSMKKSSYGIMQRQEFMYQALRGTSFIFGSVIYRKKYLTPEGYDTEKYHTFCDRVFLSNLLKEDRVALFYSEPGIFVQDHNLDESNPRPKGATLQHLVNYYDFYKTELHINEQVKRKIISNAYLLSCASMPRKVSFLQVFNAQKSNRFIDFRYLDTRGLYAIMRLLFNKKLFHFFIRIASYIKTKKYLLIASR